MPKFCDGKGSFRTVSSRHIKSMNQLTLPRSLYFLPSNHRFLSSHWTRLYHHISIRNQTWFGTHSVDLVRGVFSLGFDYCHIGLVHFQSFPPQFKDALLSPSKCRMGICLGCSLQRILSFFFGRILGSGMKFEATSRPTHPNLTLEFLIPVFLFNSFSFSLSS